MIFEQSAGSSGQCTWRSWEFKRRAAVESDTDLDAIQQKVGSSSITNDGGWPMRKGERWGRLGQAEAEPQRRVVEAVEQRIGEGEGEWGSRDAGARGTRGV